MSFLGQRLDDFLAGYFGYCRSESRVHPHEGRALACLLISGITASTAPHGLIDTLENREVHRGHVGFDNQFSLTEPQTLILGTPYLSTILSCTLLAASCQLAKLSPHQKVDLVGSQGATWARDRRVGQKSHLDVLVRSVHDDGWQT